MSVQPFSNASAVIPARYAKKFQVVPLSLESRVASDLDPEI